MTVSIGPKGHLRIAAAEVGPQRAVRVVAFKGRSDTGFIDVPLMRAGEPPVAVIDVNYGVDVTAAFGGAVMGGISQVDTGGLGDDGVMTGHTMFAIVTDTGAAGL